MMFGKTSKSRLLSKMGPMRDPEGAEEVPLPKLVKNKINRIDIAITIENKMVDGMMKRSIRVNDHSFNPYGPDEKMTHEFTNTEAMNEYLEGLIGE